MIVNEWLGEGSLASLAGTGALAFIGAFLVFFVIATIAVYIYTSWAYMSIGKKAKTKNSELAWIPVVGPLIVTSQTAKMHWWPILLLAGSWIPYVGFAASIVVTVFATIWLWKTFKKIKRPGWWAILCLIPVLNLIFIGIAAWAK